MKLLKVNQPNFVQAAGAIKSKIPDANQAYNENTFNVISSNGDVKWITVSYLPSPSGYLMNINANGTFNQDSSYYIIIDFNSLFYDAYIKNNIGTSLVGSFTANSDVAYNASYNDNGNQYWTAEWLDENHLQLIFNPDDKFNILTYLEYGLSIIIS